MNINSYYLFLLLVPSILWGQSAYQARRAAHDREYLKTFEDSRLGFKFKYYSDLDEFSSPSNVDTTSWHRISIDRFGISLNTPVPYSTLWKHKAFFCNWYGLNDTVASLDFGGGVFVDIYETTRKFDEIAFAENFYQYNLEDHSVYHLCPLDTLTVVIRDSQWVALNCGVPFDAKLLFGYSWKGLRGLGCYSVQLPKEMGGGVTYEDYIHGFLSHLTPHATMLVIDFRAQSDHNDFRSNRLDEVMFYELVASITWDRSDNITR